MRYLSDMIWVETRKAVRSKMPIFTAAGALVMPLAIGFLIFLATHPELSGKLGLVGAKANLVAYANTDWSSYLGLLAMMVAAGGFFIFIFIVAWVFGREFVDGTLKDLLAVPVPRFSIVMAKFIVGTVWFIAIAAVMLAVGLAVGALMGLPPAAPGELLAGSLIVAVTALLVIPTVMPLALFASVGRGYLLPLGVAIMLVVAANFLTVLGWGPFFPWSAPGLYAQGKGDLAPVSYAIDIMAGLAGDHRDILLVEVR